MLLTAHQPAYLPWLGYFHKVAISDVLVILDEVQFEKNSFTNRNRIKTPQGDIWLTVPVLMTGHMGKKILDMEISNNTNWKEKHWKSIYLNYKKAPYFNKYADFFESVYKKEWEKLTELLDFLFLFFLKELGIQTRIFKQSELGVCTKKQELILDLCKKLEADCFIFGKLGRDYADEGLFSGNKIKLYFQDYHHPVYTQLWGDFIPNMSIIDLLFNIGSERALDIIMDGNTIKQELRGMYNL